MNLLEPLLALLSASPAVLALLLGLAAVCLTGFSLFIVYRALLRDR